MGTFRLGGAGMGSAMMKICARPCVVLLALPMAPKLRVALWLVALAGLMLLCPRPGHGQDFPPEPFRPLGDTAARSTDSIAGPAQRDFAQPSGLDSAAVTTEPQDSTRRLSANLLVRLTLPDTVGYITGWRMDAAHWSYPLATVDSSLSTSHMYHLGSPLHGTETSMGMGYSPHLQDDFFARPSLAGALPFWMLAQEDYAATPLQLYHTLGPFARFSAGTNGSTRNNDLLASLLYTQNVTPHVNLGFDVLHGNETGEYLHQEGGVSKGQGFASVSQSHYYLAASVGGSRQQVRHNGGITEDRLLTDTVLRPATVPTRMSQASSLVRSLDATLDGAFDLVQHVVRRRDSAGINHVYREPRLSLIMQHSYSQRSRRYIDRAPAPNHPPYNISNAYTHDSVAQNTYSVRLGLTLHQTPNRALSLPSIRGWVEYRTDEYVMPRPQQYINPTLGERTRALGVGAHATYRIRHVGLEAFLDSRLWGERSTASTVGGQATVALHRDASKLWFSGGAQLRVEPPHYFLRNYYGNTSQWSLAGQLRPQQTLEINARVHAPWWGGEYGMRNALYRHYTYFDTLAMPSQINTLNILSVYVQQSFRRWGVVAFARGVYQLSSARSIVALPLLMGYAQLGYERELIRSTLTLRLSVEMYYRTAFRADTYNDALGVYHRQNGVRIGNYPMVNVVLNAKWKSANVFVALLHANQDLGSRRYFAGVHYPDRERSVRFGFQWYFL